MINIDYKVQNRKLYTKNISVTTKNVKPQSRDAKQEPYHKPKRYKRTAYIIHVHSKLNYTIQLILIHNTNNNPLHHQVGASSLDGIGSPSTTTQLNIYGLQQLTTKLTILNLYGLQQLTTKLTTLLTIFCIHTSLLLSQLITHTTDLITSLPHPHSYRIPLHYSCLFVSSFVMFYLTFNGFIFCQFFSYYVMAHFAFNNFIFIFQLSYKHVISSDEAVKTMSADESLINANAMLYVTTYMMFAKINLYKTIILNHYKPLAPPPNFTISDYIYSTNLTLIFSWDHG